MSKPKEDKLITCRTCRGKGKTVNPNIDSNGLSAEDFYDDPDFSRDYMSGVYDVQCGACGGSGKMRESRLEELRQNAEDRREAAMEDGNWEACAGSGDYRYG